MANANPLLLSVGGDIIHRAKQKRYVKMMKAKQSRLFMSCVDKDDTKPLISVNDLLFSQDCVVYVRLHQPAPITAILAVIVV